MTGSHGCGSTLRNNGNDGFINIDEREDGYVRIQVEANDEVLKRLEITVNGKAVILDERS